jgi:hypothetical protein
LVVLKTPTSRSFAPTDAPAANAAKGRVVDPAEVFTPALKRAM